MPRFIFFKDTRNPQGFDLTFRRCLIFNKNDTEANSGPFHLTVTLPDGVRLFEPEGITINGQAPLPPFEIPNDVDSPVQCAVDVTGPDNWGADNRRQARVFMVATGETLQFDGADYTVLPAIPPRKQRQGCATGVLATLTIIALAALLSIA